MPGIAIANSKGVPGTLGCLVKGREDNTWGLLSNYHVLYGKKASKDEPIWLIDYQADGEYQCREIGKTQQAKIGIMEIWEEKYFVDCAVGKLNGGLTQRHRFSHTAFSAEGAASANIGERVKKIGAATGLTYGIISDIRYPDHAYVDVKSYNAPNQILVSPEEPYRTFSQKGDSGAVLLNEQNQVVGLLWGCNANGEGVACHIAPVLKALNVKIERPAMHFLQKVIGWYRRSLAYE